MHLPLRHHLLGLWSLSLLGSAAVAQTYLGEFDFSIDADALGYYPGANASARGTVSFHYDAGSLTIAADVFNTGTARLAGFYLLKPFDFGDSGTWENPLGTPILNAGNIVTLDDPASFAVSIISASHPNSDDNWDNLNNPHDARHAFKFGFDDLVNAPGLSTRQEENLATARIEEFYAGAEPFDYYQNNNGRLEGGEAITFEFTFAEVGSLVDATALVTHYTMAEWPVLFAKWNSRTSNGSLTNWAKGWTDGYVTIVPEPAGAGLLAIALPVLLLTLRRRRPRRA
jgi:hypothetical protein